MLPIRWNQPPCRNMCVSERHPIRVRVDDAGEVRAPSGTAVPGAASPEQLARDRVRDRRASARAPLRCPSCWHGEPRDHVERDDRPRDDGREQAAGCRRGSGTSRRATRPVGCRVPASSGRAACASASCRSRCAAARSRSRSCAGTCSARCRARQNSISSCSSSGPGVAARARAPRPPSPPRPSRRWARRSPRRRATLGCDDEVILGLLRVDVHAARDDHVRLAVGEDTGSRRRRGSRCRRS